MIAPILSTYLLLNALIALGYTGLRGAEWIGDGKSFSSLLRLHYQTLGLVIAFTALAPLLPGPAHFEPVAKVWSGEPFRSVAVGNDRLDKPGRILIAENPLEVGTTAVSLTLAALLALVFSYAAIRLALDLRALRRLRERAFVHKRIGRVEILIREDLAVPFSLRTFGKAQVMLPASLLTKPESFRLALRHELQHHRQGDTLAAYALLALKALCAPNPFAHWWLKRLHEIQEFACDEAVLGQRPVDSLAYARCLFEVAEQALLSEKLPACATGFSFREEGRLTKRRIERMLSTNRPKKWNTIPLCASLALLLGASAFAAKSLVQDRRVSLAQAEAMAAVAAKTSEFPVTVNELVVAELNRYLGTPEGREAVKNALVRMKAYQPMIEEKIAEYDMPIELLAVPLIEAGYRNSEDNGKLGHGAGLWMFIRSTARAYGLRVDDQVDERLNPEILTDAAMRYWKVLYLRFRDWQLAGMGYNMGENAVQDAIEATGSRNAFDLVRAGYEGDRAYLARLMAAILILKNPESVK